MTILKISIPVYKLDSWGSLQTHGNIEVLSDCDNLSEAYEQLKPQIADLLIKVQADNQIVVTLHELQSQIRERQEVFRVLSTQIARANKQLERLTSFLNSLGINPLAGSLVIGDTVVRKLRPVQVENSPDDGDGDGCREF